jgi:uncharacterized protein (TIGR01777 family)
MNILVSGSSGFIGRALIPLLIADGHHVARLVRSQVSAGEAGVFWDPEADVIDARRLEGFDAVVHLAGENIAGRWTAKKKARIYDSRVRGTRRLCDALTKLETPPEVLVSISASGYYGDCGDAILREDHPSGSMFLSRVCRDWESATEPASQRGIRVVNPRLGVVLGAAGGALARMLLPFRLGFGGRIGTGRQYMSWVALEDVVGAIRHILAHESLHGPVNVAAPNPVTNREFTRTLGRVLGRPTIFPAPAFAVRWAFGEMADELLLASARLEPTQLVATHYEFLYPELEPALRYVLGKPCVN